MTETRQLSDPEIQRLILALLLAAGGPVREPLIVAWVGWCEEARVRSALVDMVLAGELAPSWPEGGEEPVFTAAGKAPAGPIT